MPTFVIHGLIFSPSDGSAGGASAAAGALPERARLDTPGIDVPPAPPVFSAAQQHYNNTSDWILDQATRLKDMIMAKLPTTSTWTIGFIAGFKRK
jgi:hypothetical protein